MLHSPTEPRTVAPTAFGVRPRVVAAAAPSARRVPTPSRPSFASVAHRAGPSPSRGPRSPPIILVRCLWDPQCTPTTSFLVFRPPPPGGRRDASGHRVKYCFALTCASHAPLLPPPPACVLSVSFLCVAPADAAFAVAGTTVDTDTPSAALSTSRAHFRCTRLCRRSRQARVRQGSSTRREAKYANARCRLSDLVDVSTPPTNRLRPCCRVRGSPRYRNDDRLIVAKPPDGSATSSLPSESNVAPTDVQSVVPNPTRLTRRYVYVLVGFHSTPDLVHGAHPAVTGRPVRSRHTRVAPYNPRRAEQRGGAVAPAPPARLSATSAPHPTNFHERATWPPTRVSAQ